MRHLYEKVFLFMTSHGTGVAALLILLAIAMIASSIARVWICISKLKLERMIE